MNLQGNGNNHNHRPKPNEGEDAFISFRESSDYERITGQKPGSVSADGSAEFGTDEERAQKLQQAKETENSSAYDDLDDFVYRQDKKRKRSSSSSHHHHHHSRVEGLKTSSRRKSKTPSGHKHKHHYSKHHRHKKKWKRWQKALAGLGISVVALLLAVVITVVALINIGRNALLDLSSMNIKTPPGAVATENGRFIVYNGIKYQYNENVTSVLFMGIDKQGFSNINGKVGTAGNADSIFVLAMNLETGESNIISISRDTMAEIEIYSDDGAYAGVEEAQLCLAYAYGNGSDEASCVNELNAVRKVMYEIPINSYMAINLDGIGPITDAVGGVSVVSPETIGEFKEGETYNLTGSLAQSFVRTRSHENEKGNQKRMLRQKAFLDSFATKVYNNTKNNITYPVTLFNDVSPYAYTNFDAAKVSYLASTLLQGKYQGFDILTAPGEAKKGEEYAEFYLDETKFFEMILDVYYTPVGEE